jgi:hypothetical protein
MKRAFQTVWIAILCTALVSCGGGSTSTPGSQSDTASRGGGNTETADISGPPVINPAFGARMPRKCSPVKHVPSETEAAALIQCATEKGGEPGAFDPLIYLWQNVHVQMGTSRSYAYNSDSHNNSIDTTAKVYPIRVTGDQLSCTGQPTCKAAHADNSEGSCYQTTFGDWQCYSDFFGVADTGAELPRPTTY